MWKVNTGKYGPEITPYLNTFLAVVALGNWRINGKCCQMKQLKDEYITYSWICNMPQVAHLGDEQHDLTDLYNHIIIVKHCNRICYTVWKVSKYGVISGPRFPAFGLNMEIYSINLCIQSKYRKIRTRNNSVFGHFSRSTIRSRFNKEHKFSSILWNKTICQEFKDKLNAKFFNPNLNLSGRNLKNLTNDKILAALSNYRRHKKSDNGYEIDIFFIYVLFNLYLDHTYPYIQIFTHEILL